MKEWSDLLRRSIKKNVDIILAYISEYNPTIVTLTETWLSSNDIYTITMLYNFSTNLHTYSFICSDRVYGIGVVLLLRFIMILV